MMYPFLVLDDGAEIVHSDMDADGRVKVYIEKPDENDCFHYATCMLPEYVWSDVYGFKDEEMKCYDEVVSSTANLILEFAKGGGFEHAHHRGAKRRSD